GIAEAKQYLEPRVDALGVLEGIASEVRLETPGQPAQPVGGEVEARCRAGGVDGSQRVAGGQEHDVSERPGDITGWSDGGLADRAAEPVPGAHEDAAHGI